MNHYVYKITDPITKQYYFGVRSSELPPEMDLQYKGSMRWWKPADTTRLVKEVIGIYDSRKNALIDEREYQTKYIQDKLCMNGMIQPIGMDTFGKTHSEETKNKIATKAKKRLKDPTKNPMYGVSRYGSDNPFYGKKHSEETIKNIKETCRIKSLGENNPMYGKKHSEETLDKIRKLSKRVGAENGKSKEVIHINSGIKYPSLRQACIILGLKYQTELMRIRNDSKLKQFNPL